MRSAFLLLTAFALAQVSFDQAARDLGSSDPEARLRSVRLIKEGAYPDAALPLVRLLADPVDDVQLEAIAAELNIFLAEKIVPRRRIGFVIEVRSRIDAETAFANGPLALGPRPVPMDVLGALRAASRDENPRVAIEAVYAFGALGVEPGGPARRELLAASAPALAAMLGVPDPAFRAAALRVIGRLYEPRPQDDGIDQMLGDAVVGALNDPERAVRAEAMDALGEIRYDRALQALTDLYAYYGKGELAELSFDAIARIAHASSAPLFASALASKSPAVKRTAVEGLARVGDRAKLAEIQAAAASDRRASLQLAAAFAAVMLADAPVDPLAEALRRDRREQAWRYLVEAAPGRTPALLRYAQDPDARLRADMADILGIAGDPAALRIVEPLLQDRDAQVAASAARAAARLRAAVSRPRS